MESLTQYFKHVRAEFDHITWPSRKEAIAHTLIVVLVTAITALLAAALDTVFTGVLRNFLG